MSNKQEDANLILRLYELRREETMRQARDWFTTDFVPESVQDLFTTMVGEDNAKYRMVTSYWDMAAAFVNHGAIDEQLFNEIHFEHLAVYAKVEPFLDELRQMRGAPYYLAHLEQLIRRMPDHQERLALVRSVMKGRRQARQQAMTKNNATDGTV